MKIIISIVLALFSICAISQNINQSKDNWKKDIIFYSKKLQKKHKSVFHTLTKEQFTEEVRSLEENIPNLSNNEIFVRLMQMTAAIGDGHTVLWTPDSFKMFPLRFTWFNDSLRLVRASSDYSKILGMKLVKINTLDITEVNKRILTLINSGESETYPLVYSAYYILFPDILLGLGIINETKKIEFTFQDDLGNYKKIKMVPEKQNNIIKEKFEYVCNPIPLFLKTSNKPISINHIKEKLALYINFNDYPDWDIIKKSTDSVIKHIESNNVNKLVIDFRNNYGGDFNKGLFLINSIKNIVKKNECKVYVLIGRATFSASMANAIHFREILDATIVGEPSGGNPIQYGENDEITLPNSKLTVSYSTRFYKFQEKDTRGVIPNKMILLNWNSFKQGNDNVLNWILDEN